MITPSIRMLQYGTIWYYERVKNQYRHETYKEITSVRKKFADMNPKSQKFKSSNIVKCLSIYYGYPEYVMSGNEKSIRHFNEVVVSEITKGYEAIDQPFF